MNLPADIDKLVQRYATGQITRDEMDTLESWLREDPSHIQWFASYGLVEQGLLTIGRESTATDLMGALTEIEAAAPPVALVDLTDELKHRKLRKLSAERARARRSASQSQADGGPVVISKLAVVLAAAAVLGLIAWLGWPDTQPAASSDPTAQQGDPDVPRTLALATNVAFIRSSADARWVGLAYDHNHYLRGGKTVTLRAGLAEVVFGDGAAVIIEGPATFEPTGPNAMRLDTGRIVATIPDSAHGFTVATPSGLITDYGTEFGVHVNTDGQTLAQTYSGRIGLTPSGGEEIDLYSGDAVVADTHGRVREVEAEDLTFVRTEEFEAIRNTDSSPRDRWIAARYGMLRDPAVVAFVPFIQPGNDWPGGIGYRELRVLNEAVPANNRPLDGRDFRRAIEWSGDPGHGESLVANGADPIFIDLDTEWGGVFDAAGLLDDNKLIGRPGSTLYIMWRMQGDGTGQAPDSYAGLSLMRGDQRASDEPLFIGSATTTSDWSIHPRHAGVLFSDAPDIQVLTEEGASMPSDSRAHLWLVRIDFMAGPDRVQVYLDPDLGLAQLPQPNATLNGYDITFDRLRFVTGDGALAWRIDDVLVSTARPTGSPGTLPVD